MKVRPSRESGIGKRFGVGPHSWRCFFREHGILKTAYVGQRIANLRFALYRRALDPALFRIFRRRSIERESYRAELWVIGSSHAINIQSRGATISEVLTADEKTLPSDGRIELIADFQKRRLTHEVAGKFFYQTDLELQGCSMGDCGDGPPCPFDGRRLFRMEHRFPSGEGVAAAPLTLIDVVRADQERLEVRTFHSYVEDFAVVFTRSVLEVA